MKREELEIYREIHKQIAKGDFGHVQNLCQIWLDEEREKLETADRESYQANQGAIRVLKRIINLEKNIGKLIDKIYKENPEIEHNKIRSMLKTNQM